MNVLPDSRLITKKGRILVQWVVDGIPQRVELEPVYCANCGKPNGYVPVQFTSFAFWLCETCVETHGAIAGTYMTSDQVFWRRLEEAMLHEYGHTLSKEELQRLGAEGWGRLKSLVSESPYRNMAQGG